MKERNINKQGKEMKGINLILMKAKQKQYKERKQEHDLDRNTKMPKYMANASFYRLKFGTIDLLTN
jgi:hypothetical protein